MIKVRENIPLAPLTTFGVGGVARFFVEVYSVEDASAAFREAKRRGLKVAVLGGGSNTLVRDAVFDGLAILVRISGMDFQERDDGTVAVTAGAGVVWDELVHETVTRGLQGLECLSGVPGTVGGAVVSSIGAYGAQVGDTLERVSVIDRTSTDFTIRDVLVDECLLTYHNSIFARNPDKYFVTSATFVLRSGEVTLPTYKDYRFSFPQNSTNKKLTLDEIREALLNIREEKGALFMKGRKSYRSAGSFFGMPYISKEMYARVLETARAHDAEKEERLRPWAWEQTDGSFKIAPGFLLEYTEFHKGYTRDTVGLSPKHVLSIIALQEARAEDIEKLAEDMQKSVEHIFGIRIEREVKIFAAE